LLLARANHLRSRCGHTRFTPREERRPSRVVGSYTKYKRQCPVVRLSRLPAKRTRVQPRQTWGRFYTSKPLTRYGTIAPDWGLTIRELVNRSVPKKKKMSLIDASGRNKNEKHAVIVSRICKFVIKAISLSTLMFSLMADSIFFNS